MAQPLSNQDILEHPVARKNNIRLVTYPELMQMTNIEQLFQGRTVVVLLYNVIAPGNGHWVLLIKHVPECGECTKYGSNRAPGKHCPDGVIEFFDSYGSKIDWVLSIQNKHKRRHLNQPETRLSHLLGKSPYCIVYNDQQVQKKGGNIVTCGHHCLARLRLRHLDVDDYIKTLKAAGPDPDDTVLQMYRGLM